MGHPVVNIANTRFNLGYCQVDPGGLKEINLRVIGDESPCRDHVKYQHERLYKKRGVASIYVSPCVHLKSGNPFSMEALIF